MARLDGIQVEALEEALAELERHREAERLLAAIIYKRGPSVPKIANWFDKREATIYRWFDRLEAGPIREAMRDEPRTGRPPKLAGQEWDQFVADLHSSPEAAGYDAPAWTPNLARRHLLAEYGVEYTTRHVRRLMNESGLS